MSVIDEPAEVKQTSKKSLGPGAILAILIVSLLLALLLFAFISPFRFSRAGVSSATRSLNNGKDIYMSMRDYAFNNNGTLPPAKANANDSLRILFEEGHSLDEKPFYLKEGGDHLKTALQADENTQGKEALKEGELYFPYWTKSDGTPHSITNDKENTPCLSIPNLAASGVRNFKNAIFHNEVLNRQAVVISIDGAGYVHPLNKNGIIESYESKEGYSMEKSVEMDWNECSPVYPLGTKNAPEK